MVNVRRWLAVVVLVVYATFEGAVAAALGSGWWAALFAFFAVAVAVAAVGVARRSLWAWWLALGIGVTGMVDVIGAVFRYGLNAHILLFALMPLGVLLMLVGARKHYATAPWTEMWVRSDWRLRFLEGAIIFSVPAVAGLLRYVGAKAFFIGCDERGIALSCAALFACGAVATASKRTVGPLLMLAAAFASLGLATGAYFGMERYPPAMTHMRWDYDMLRMSVGGFVPGILATFGALAALAMPMWRFIRRPQ
jgi:hypothetical protein